MKKFIKAFWGCIPIAFILLCVAVKIIVKATIGYTLRIVPMTILVLLSVVSLGVFLLWTNIKYSKYAYKTDTAKSYFLRAIIRFSSLVVFSASVMISLIFLVFGYAPEHIVTKNDIKMVAQVHSFLDTNVEYYQYKNFLFKGKKLGYENYGNGSFDPFVSEEQYEPTTWTFYDLQGNVIDSGTNFEIDNYYYDQWQQEEKEALLEQEERASILKQKAEIKKFDISILENRKDELVFSISINDYIDGYNGFHWADYKSRYLLPPDKWKTQVLDTAIHSNYETMYYYFTADEKIFTLPAFAVYVPTNADYIQEITLNYDWHSYTENMYELYEEMCLYTLRIFFPDLSDEKIIDLYSGINDLGYENVFSSDEWYSADSVPYALHYRGNIGVYSHFAIGSWQRLCIIPVTEETVKELEQKGAIIYEIE